MIVCDTNVLISAFIFPGGWPDKIVRGVIEGRLSHATSPDILSEFKKILIKKFKLSIEKIEEIIILIQDSSDLVYPTDRLSIIKVDPADNRILECGMTAKADYIVTGDKKHLLSLKKYKEIQIVSPQQFAVLHGIL